MGMAWKFEGRLIRHALVPPLTFALALALDVFLTLSPVTARAQSVSPFFSYQGRAFDTNGTSPLLRTVDIKLQIRSSNGACLLYEELQSGVNLSATNGYFSLNVGSVLGDSKRTGVDPGLSMARVFSNTGQVRASDTDCVGGYTPASGDKRRLRVTIVDGGVSTTLNPDQDITSVPYATVAETLQGVSASGFIQVSGAVTQANLSDLVAKKTELLALAGNATALSALASGSSTLYMKPAAGGVSLTGTGDIALSAQKSLQLGTYSSAQQTIFAGGLTASDKGKTWYNSDTNSIMYWDGTSAKALGSATAITSINGSTQVGQSLAIGSSGTAPAWATDAAAGIHTLNIPQASTSGVTAGLLSNAEYAALAPKNYVDLNLAGKSVPTPAAGDDGKSLRWNNTSGAWEYFAPSSGSVTSLSSTAPLSIGGTASSPQVSLNIGAGLTTTGGNLVPNFGTTSGTIAAGDDARITGALAQSSFNAYVAGASGVNACASGESMYWNSVSSQFDCATIGLAASQITSGTIDSARLPLATGASAGGVIVGTGLGVSSGTVSVAYGNSAGSAVEGNNTRLNPAPIGDASDATKMVRMNAAGTGYELRSPTEVVSDLGLGTAATTDASTFLTKSGNLSGLANTATARGNLGLTATGDALATAASASAARTTLGLGGAATLSVGTSSGTVAAGDDARITGALAQSAFNAYVAPVSGGTACTTNQMMYWNSVSSTFACANVSIAGTQITSGTLSASRLPAASGSADGIVTQSAQTFAGDKTFANNLLVSGNQTLSGSLTINGKTITASQIEALLSLFTIQTAGAACGTNDRIAIDSTGAVLTCISSVWTAAATAATSADPFKKAYGAGGDSGFTGAIDYNFIVPAGVTLVKAKIWGAAGGRGWNFTSLRGGRGGFTYAEIPVTPGETLTLIVGESGRTSGGGTRPNGGGGLAGTSDGGNGGGRSAIRRGSTELATAGGGGGTGPDSINGGPAGGASGTAGQNNSSSTGGQGGTQSAGGAAGTPTNGNAGSQYQGGDFTLSGNRGGAGGGGYYGGGASGSNGGFDGSGGGGGSGYVASGVGGYTSAASWSAAANNTDTDYAGYAGDYNSTTPVDGRIVIYYP